MKGDAQSLLESSYPRCKIQPVGRFRNESHWVIDRWWTRSEKEAIEGIESIAEVTKRDIDTTIGILQSTISEYEDLVAGKDVEVSNMRTVRLGDDAYFQLFIGRRVLKKNVINSPMESAKIPVYSANVFEPMGYMDNTRISDFSRPSILWGIDGNFEFSMIPADITFATTDHCGTIQIIDPSIVPEYVLYALYLSRREESFERSFRASLANMRKFSLQIPITKVGIFDVTQQRLLGSRFEAMQEKKQEIQALKAELDNRLRHYISSSDSVG